MRVGSLCRSGSPSAAGGRGRCCCDSHLTAAAIVGFVYARCTWTAVEGDDALDADKRSRMAHLRHSHSAKWKGSKPAGSPNITPRGILGS